MCPCSAYFESNWDDMQNYFLIQWHEILQVYNHPDM
jgi:hypothetical protein